MEETLYNIEILQSNKGEYIPYWKKDIEDDFILLYSEKILTARLAVAIYKSSTLEFNASNKKIGIYFNKNLGIKSKTIKLGKRKQPNTLKAYKLKESPQYILLVPSP